MVYKARKFKNVAYFSFSNLASIQFISHRFANGSGAGVPSIRK